MSTPILIAAADPHLVNAIKTTFEHFPDFVPVTPEDTLAHQAEVAICWRPSASLIRDFPNLRLLQSAAAGVDHFGPETLAAGLPICRIVDDGQRQGMLEYALWAVLHHQREFDRIFRNQSMKVWQGFTQRSSNDTRIGVLGMGAIGGYVAQGLSRFGYPVAGWCRSPKTIEGVSVYCGDAELNDFLSRTEVLINLLPLNTTTHSILNNALFTHLPKGATLVNVGRGAHLVEEDLLSALADEHLRMAILDVFSLEPLPEAHPFWSHPKVVVTPHIASSAPVSAMTEHVVENARRLSRGESLKNQVINPESYRSLV